jgi:tetratricopeptide (TPR) repeat protein
MLNHKDSYKPGGGVISSQDPSMALPRPSQAQSVRDACRLNLAACLLKMGEYERVVSACNEVLSKDAMNRKALFRRGQGYASLGRLSEAEGDLDAYVSINPGQGARIRTNGSKAMVKNDRSMVGFLQSDMGCLREICRELLLSGQDFGVAFVPRLTTVMNQ